MDASCRSDGGGDACLSVSISGEGRGGGAAASPSPSPCVDGVEDPAGETTGGTAADVAGDITGDIAGSIGAANDGAGACANDRAGDCEWRDASSASDAGDRDPGNGEGVDADSDSDSDNDNAVGSVGGSGGGVGGTTTSTPLAPTAGASSGSNPDGPDPDGDRGKSCAATSRRESGEVLCNAEVGDIDGLVTRAAGDRNPPWLVTPTPPSPRPISAHLSSARRSAPLPTTPERGLGEPEPSSLPASSDCAATARRPVVGSLAGAFISSALFFSSNSFSMATSSRFIFGLNPAMGINPDAAEKSAQLPKTSSRFSDPRSSSPSQSQSPSPSPSPRCPAGAALVQYRQGASSEPNGDESLSATASSSGNTTVRPAPPSPPPPSPPLRSPATPAPTTRAPSSGAASVNCDRARRRFPGDRSSSSSAAV